MRTKSYKVNTDQVSTESFDDEVMIVNLEKGNYYSLTGSAADAWALIEAGLPEHQVCEQLRVRYSGDPEDITSGVSAFIADLRNEGLIEPGHSEVSQADAVLDAAADSGQKPEFSPPQLEKYTDMQELLLIDPIHEVSDEHGWPKMKAED